MTKIKKKYQKEKQRRKILILLSLIVIIIGTIKVNAGSQDSTLERNIIDGYYSIADLSDGRHLYYLEQYKVNGKIAYCIQLGIHITTNTYDSTTNLYESGLSTEKLDYIRKLMYYGYGYQDHQDIKYYMATQEMIWEYLNGREVYWTQEYSKEGQAINIDNYKNEITNLIKQLNIAPSFNNNTYEVLAGTKVNITDSNNMLSEYAITKKGNQKYNIDNNTLYVDTNKNEFQNDIIEVTRKNYYKEESKLYKFSGSQTLMSPGKLDMPTAQVTIKTIGATLNIDLVDKETKEPSSRGQATLSGAKYEIYDENYNLITTIETEEGNTKTIDNLLPQKYYIKQISSSEGYKINDNIVEITIDKLINHITLEEEIIKSTIEILKIYGDKDTNEYNSELGIKFNIYDNNQTLQETLITDEKGFASTILLYGTYIIKQENTTEGYKKIKDINISINEDSKETIRYNLYDDLIRIKLKINTKDKETLNKILESNIAYKIKNTKTNTYISYNEKEEFKTNELGEVLLPIYIPYGTYELEQTTPPDKYLENKEIITIEINSSSNIELENDDLILNIDYLNKPIKGKLHIITNQEEFKEEKNKYSTIITPRKNIDLEIYAKEDIISADRNLIYKKNETIEKITTDEYGEIDSSILYLGEYCIREINNIKEDYCVKLDKVDNKTSIVTKTITLTENINKYNVTLTNLDEETKETISNTIIDLYNEEGIIINTSITNEDGIIKLPELSEGKYYFQEVKVNDEYILNEEKIYFEIKDEDLNLEVYNTKIKNTIPIPNTLSNKNYIIQLISLSLIILGIILYVYKKKYHKLNIN